MIGKITQGKYFAGVVNYALGKKDARLLDSMGVFDESASYIIRCFDYQCLLNPRLENKVGHISLSFSVQDQERLTDDLMTEIAVKYLERMEITDTQFVIVRHNDREHPHCHIIFNRVSNSGKTISDSGNYYRNIKVCKELTKDYGLYMPKGKEQVKMNRLREPAKSKYIIWKALKDGLEIQSSWDKLKDYLSQQGIEVHFKYKGQTNIVQGVSFKLGKYSFKGSEIDRTYSFVKINIQLENNQTHIQKQAIRPSVYSKNPGSWRSFSKIQNNILSALFNASVVSHPVKPKFSDDEEDLDEDEIEELRKRRKRGIK